MPTAVMRPSSRSATRSASMTVDGRCATMSAVVDASTLRSSASTFASVATSSAESGSSSTSTDGDAATARASARRCRWPPERLMPSSPTFVSTPSGRSYAKPACAMRSASVEHPLGLGAHRGLVARELGPAEQHVVAHRGAEQRRVLERHRDVRAQLLAGERADVDAVERDRARGHVVEARRERRQRGLAAAGEADERHGLARLEREVDAVEQVAEPVGRVLVAEPHVGEDELAARALDRDRALGVGDLVLAVEDVEEPVGRGARVHREGEQEPDRLDRPRQHRRRGEERDELADGERALRGEPDAEHEAHGERDGRHHEDPRPDAGVEPRLLDLGAAQRLGLRAEGRQRVLAAPERLEHADAVHRLLDGRGEVARLVLAASGHLGVAALEPVADDPERDRADEEHEPEHPVHRDEDRRGRRRSR